MPAKNTIKFQIPDSYYHVYIRGINKQKIFYDVNDYNHFLKLFSRYLSPYSIKNKDGNLYPNYRSRMELLTYCLLTNHFHLLVYQFTVPGLELFMRSIMTSYSKYFNLKYQRSGPLFESRYKAILITDEAHLLHISRYIHLNPSNWLTYSYSSIKAFISESPIDWLSYQKLLTLFGTREKYLAFIKDYVPIRDDLAVLKLELAND